jgi:hypothetical protein
MSHGNVVVSVHEHGWKTAFRVLQGFGAVKSCDFLNRLSRVDEEPFLDKVLLEALEQNGTPGPKYRTKTLKSQGTQSSCDPN